MQDEQFAKFKTESHEYIAKRNKEGECWRVIYGRLLLDYSWSKPKGHWTQLGDRWFNFMDPGKQFQTTSNFKDFTLLDSSEVEELFYEVL